MSESPRKPYRPWEPQRDRQEAQSPDATLPQGDGVFFWLDLVPQWNLRQFYAPYEDETRGAPPFDPALRVCLLLYAYCVGGVASRTMAQAGERPVAFGAIVGTDRPDCRPIRDFRTLHLAAFQDVWGQVRRGAGAAGLVKRGQVATDGTTRPGNAARHKARS